MIRHVAKYNNGGFMNNSTDVKDIVKEKYAEIVTATDDCGCGGCCGSEKYSTFNDDYSEVKGYVAEADLKLGCGMPTEHAGIKEGDTVLDLGSGAGNDVFVARELAGAISKIIGLDMTSEMIEKAEENKSKLGFDNIEFVLGEIEDMPIEENSIDVVVSNCVLNLVPNKKKAFSEIYRVLKTGARFCISDVVINGEMPKKLLADAELYAGCVSGAMKEEDYLLTIHNQGFKDVEIKSEKNITLPDQLLDKYLNDAEKDEFLNSDIAFKSITVIGYK